METQSHVTQLTKKGKQKNETNQSQYFPERNEINVPSSVLFKFSHGSLARRIVSWMRRSAAAAASRLGRNVGAPGLSSVGLSGGGVLSHTSSNRQRCCTGRSKTNLPTCYFAPQTTWSRPMISSSIMPRGQQLRLRSTDLIITTSPTARLLSALPYLSRCRPRNARRYSSDATLRPWFSTGIQLSFSGLFCPGDRARVLAVCWNW